MTMDKPVDCEHCGSEVYPSATFMCSECGTWICENCSVGADGMCGPCREEEYGC